KRHLAPTDLAVHRNVYDKVLKHADLWDLDSVHFLSKETLEKAGIDIRSTLPDGVSAILLTARFPYLPKDAARSQEIEGEFGSIAQLNLDFAELDTCRELEALGYSALPKARIDHKPFRTLCGIYEDEKTHIRTDVILTSAPFADKSCALLTEMAPKGDLRAMLERFAKIRGADLFGVASAQTVGELAGQLRELRKDEEILLAVDKNTRFKPYDPEVTVQKRAIYDAQDILPGAKSVLVLGMHYPEPATERVGQPPAEAVGPYVFTQYEVHRLIGHLGYAVARMLNAMGYQAVFTHNLTGAGSYVGSPRGPFHDATCNALEAVAAGIGKMAYNGSVETEEYGIHQRFIALVTDAPLAADKPQGGGADACAACGKCLEACPTCALCAKALTELDLGGEKVRYLPVDANRCDWASKYALACEEGNVYLGNLSDVPCPDEITPENLMDALRTQDCVFKYRPVTAWCAR
ncbi:MAG TPA: hypothetical protein PKE04_05920, partial [Clostridia bacterium]|nr:hypothetical protein [Clostridia bacterium]